jgi:hypothetical protein
MFNKLVLKLLGVTIQFLVPSELDLSLRYLCNIVKMGDSSSGILDFAFNYNYPLSEVNS